MLSGKSVALLVGGGVAACKAPLLVRLLRARGAQVRCALTKAAHRFVTPLSLASLSEAPVRTALFGAGAGSPMEHIRLSREADLILLAPATANLMGKMAHGLADDLVSATLLASDKPVLAAPAMNWRMWTHPATRRNATLLLSDGVRFVGPVAGEMACAEHGNGRMAEPQAIVEACEGWLAERMVARPLAGRRAIVTAGPTLEAIDPVRVLTNRSSGRQGVAIANWLARRGAAVTLVAGPIPAVPEGAIAHVGVESTEEMREAVRGALPADIAIFAAAVCDWRTARVHATKMKKAVSRERLALSLERTPDILAGIAALEGDRRPALVVGFAAETGELAAKAREKREAKGCDWLVANDVSAGNAIMGGEENEVMLLTPEGEESWPRMAKSDVARRLVSRIEAHFAPERERAL